LAHAQWKQKNNEEAQKTAQAAHDLLIVKRKPTPELADCLDLLGLLRESDGDAEGARKKFKEALEVQRKVLPVQPLLLTERHRRLAAALIGGDVPGARTHYKKAVEISEKRLGTRASVTADCLLDLGRFELLHGEKEQGIAAIELAIEIHKETNGETSDEAARALQFAASAFQEAHDLERAVEYYNLALKLRERQLGGSAADFATLLMGLAETHTLLGNDAPAMELLQQAVGKLANRNDGLYAVALENLGEVYAGVNRFPDAIACFKKAKVVWAKDPTGHAQALRANAAFLDQVQPHMPSEGGTGVPLFKYNPRSRQQPRQQVAVETFDSQPAGQETGFPFGFSRAASTPTAWVPMSFGAEQGEAAPYQAPYGAPPQAPAPEPMATIILAPASPASMAPQPIAPPPPVFANVAPAPPLVAHIAPVTPYFADGLANVAPPVLAHVASSVAGSPIPDGVGGSSLLVSFVGPDGSPIASSPAAAPQDPVQMTIIVPEEGLPKHAVLTPVDAPSPETKLVDLTGWEELSFEFLAIN
jgi:tetratricopeptide (TPR) repeat protein